MSKNPMSGQPGNTLPIVSATSSDEFLLDYFVGFRTPVTAIASTAYAVQSSESGTLFVYGGNASGVVITLPSPQKGLSFEFCATGAISSAGTKFTCATTGTFITVGDSGGADSIQGSATTAEFAVAGPGVHCKIVGLSTANWLFRGYKSGSSAASTGHFAASS